MRLGVIADTHGDMAAIARVVLAAGVVDGWLHLGDNALDAKELENSGVPVYSVAGNCDVSGEYERVVGVCGAKLLLTHGHMYGVSAGLSRLQYRAQELGCAAALFGHTHVPLLDEEGEILLLNPGSPSSPRMGSPRSYALLYVENGRVDADLMQL